MTKPKPAKKAAAAKPKPAKETGPRMLEVASLKPGQRIIHGVRRQAHEVTDSRAARLAGFHVVTAKNLATGYVSRFTVRSGVTVREATK